VFGGYLAERVGLKTLVAELEVSGRCRQFCGIQIQKELQNSTGISPCLARLSAASTCKPQKSSNFPACENLLCKREIEFIKSCRGRRNPLKSGNFQRNVTSRFSPFYSPSFRKLPAFTASRTTFLLRLPGNPESLSRRQVPSRIQSKPSRVLVKTK
jgi:hypothetical protein